jgi:hypothetical protein
MLLYTMLGYASLGTCGSILIANPAKQHEFLGNATEIVSALLPINGESTLQLIHALFSRFSVNLRVP